tara:strand:+ start:1255 stop:1413 length:159 start_codon:yes stop_codon:yes gene_type:complete
MSKMSDWVIDMQQDCVELDRAEFCCKHGEMFAYIYDEHLIDAIADAEASVKH